MATANKLLDLHICNNGRIAIITNWRELILQWRRRQEHRSRRDDA